MSIWRHARTPAELNAAATATLGKALGILITEVGEDFVRGTMPVDERTRQPYGLLHGGASVALAETLGSVGASLCVDPATQRCVGQEINANHVRSARDGLVTGTARPLYMGGRSHVWGIEIANDEGELVCISRLTVAIIRALKQGS